MRTAVVEPRTFAPQPTAVRRAVLRPSEVTDWLPTTLSEIAESLRHRRIIPNGFPFSRRHPVPDGLVIVEAGFPLSLPIGTDGTTQASELPAGPVAVTTYSGPYENITAAHVLLTNWLNRHNARPAGDAWEIYHSPPIGNPDAWHPEIIQPYEDAQGNNPS